jgi:hypothetical protein
MFQEVNVNGRYALRWAVRAAAYADLSKDQDGDALAKKALQCYGLALTALGDSLAMPGKVPDDYDLMTVVVLDIFEASLHAGISLPSLIFCRLYILQKKPPKNRMPRAWLRFSDYGAQTWFITHEVGVFSDLPITGL